jgi:hypothetical protein
MPAWQIDPQEYLKRLKLGREDFKKRLKLPDIDSVAKIIPLRDLKVITSLIPIDTELVLYLLRQIRTLDCQMPFRDIDIQMVRIDPRHLKIGQKFVYRENYQKILESVPEVFRQFMVTAGGLGDLGAYFAFGLNGDDRYAMACYLPPVVEKQDRELVIMDGIHRNYIAKQAGLAINVILVEGVSLPFPCGMRDWREITVLPLADKPKDLNDRYFDLNKGLFRDLKYLGVDG